MTLFRSAQPHNPNPDRGGVSRMRIRLRWEHCALRSTNLMQRGYATQPERLSGVACMFAVYEMAFGIEMIVKGIMHWSELL